MNYDFNAGNGNPNYDVFVEMLDGFCMEHVMVFEAAISGALEAPFIRVDALENLIQLRERLVEAGKYLLVRAYPGPLGIVLLLPYPQKLFLLLIMLLILLLLFVHILKQYCTRVWLPSILPLRRGL